MRGKGKDTAAAAGAGKQRKADKKTPHQWTEIAAQTSFDFDALEMLAAHHRILGGFCSDPIPESAYVRAYSPSVWRSLSDDALTEQRSSSEGDVDRPANANNTESVAISLSFAQYCLSLSTLLLHGTASQQFEYLFHAYAVESERGITRAELFQMLQDHFHKRPVPESKPSHNKSLDDTDARHFERMYTWLKKHMVVYDQSRCGFLQLPTALEMLRAHPSALQHFQLQIDPLIRKLHENDAKYHEKAVAAQIQ